MQGPVRFIHVVVLVLVILLAGAIALVISATQQVRRTNATLENVAGQIGHVETRQSVGGSKSYGARSSQIIHVRLGENERVVRVSPSNPEFQRGRQIEAVVTGNGEVMSAKVDGVTVVPLRQTPATQTTLLLLGVGAIVVIVMTLIMTIPKLFRGPRVAEPGWTEETY